MCRHHGPQAAEGTTTVFVTHSLEANACLSFPATNTQAHTQTNTPVQAMPSGSVATCRAPPRSVNDYLPPSPDGWFFHLADRLSTSFSFRWVRCTSPRPNLNQRGEGSNNKRGKTNKTKTLISPTSLKLGSPGDGRKLLLTGEKLVDSLDWWMSPVGDLWRPLNPVAKQIDINKHAGGDRLTQCLLETHY